MANTMVKISSVIVGFGGAANIEFTNIPQTFTDLEIIFSVRSDRAGYGNDDGDIELNGSSADKSSRVLFGSGSAISPGNNSRLQWGYPNAATSSASVFTSGQCYIPNYTSANFKSISFESVGENNAAAAYQMISAGLWSNTAAITSIRLYPVYGTKWEQYSSATLYGILKA